MGQTFLQQMIPAMEQGVALLVPLGILLALLQNLGSRCGLSVFKKALYWGFWGSIFMVAVKTGTRNAVSREVFEGIAVGFSLVGEWCLLMIFLSERSAENFQSGRFFRIVIFLTVMTLGLYRGMEIWLLPVSAAAAAAEWFSYDVLVKTGGFLAGLLLAGLGGYLTFQAARALTYGRLLFVLAVQTAALSFQQIVFLIQILMARQLLPGGALIRGMAPLIDHQSWFIFGIFFITLLVPVTLFLQKKPARPDGSNPAEYRKILSHAIHKKRWGTASVLCLSVIAAVSSFGSVYANQKEELVPSVPVTAESGTIGIPLKQVEDGHLHRYVYRASGGEEVRFIVIQKGGSAYGVGLDACEICGPTGYIEKDGQVICRLCDVMMNKATIGMRGGCNPVPLKYTVENGQLYVMQNELEQERKRFQ